MPGFVAAHLPSAVVDNATNSVSNDQIVFVTSKEILNAIQGPLSESDAAHRRSAS